jgi:hypothetical protein
MVLFGAAWIVFIYLAYLAYGRIIDVAQWLRSRAIRR